ncbi:MAG: hypothetical protein RR202_11405 [Bacteroidales bacterium]
MQLLEYLIIGAIIIYQFVFSFKLIRNISLYKFLFKNEVSILSYEKTAPKLIADSDNLYLERIITPLNRYLTANFGAALNFTIIKDIIDREVDLREEEISQKLPVPLYLGLAATMVGIICGLISMDVSANEVTSSISGLIWSVMVAMFASLCGLAWTTILTSFIYKEARITVASGKADLLNLLQTDLIPEINKADDSELNGLKTCLNEFSRQSTYMIVELKAIGEQTARVMTDQKAIINKVENLDINKIAKYNLEVFEKIDNSFEALNQFSGYLGELNKVANKLTHFAESIDQVETLIQNIDANTTHSNKLTQFLSTHLTEIDKVSTQTQNALVKSNNDISRVMDELYKEIGMRMDGLSNNASNFGVAMEEHSRLLYEGMEKVAKANADHLSSVLVEFTPDFRPLGQLNHLHEGIETLSKLMAETLRKLEDRLLPDVESIKKSNERLVNPAALYGNSHAGGYIKPEKKEVHTTPQNHTSIPNSMNIENLIGSTSSIESPPQNIKSNPNNLSNDYQNQNRVLRTVTSPAPPRPIYVEWPENNALIVKIDSLVFNKDKHIFIIQPDMHNPNKGTFDLCHFENHRFLTKNYKNLEIACNLKEVSNKDQTLETISVGRVTLKGERWEIENKLELKGKNPVSAVGKFFGK